MKMEKTLQDVPTQPSVTIQKYDAVNGAWPVSRQQLPKLTEAVARRAFKALWRHRFGKPFQGRIRGNNRTKRTYGNERVFTVAHNSGWWMFVHDLSHWIHRRQYPDQSPHRGSSHAAVERDLIEQVVQRGWLEKQPKAKAEKPKPDLKTKRYGLVLAAIKRWETKDKRADTALKKLRRKKSAYERVLK